MALWTQDDGVDPERSGISKKQSDVVDVSDPVADQDRRVFFRIWDDVVECAFLDRRTYSTGKHASVQIETGDRSDDLLVGDEKRGFR